MSLNNATVDGSPKEWKASLFSVFSSGPVTCFVTILCPCYQYGVNSEAMGGSCCPDGFVYGLMQECGLCCLVHAPLRKRIREKHGIVSSNDCLITCCCPCCAIIQEATQVAK